MRESIENLKSLLPIIAAIVALAGFYYTTQHRLDHIEAEIDELKQQDKKIKKLISKNRKQNEKN